MADYVNPSTCEVVTSHPGKDSPWIQCTREQSTAWLLIAQRYRKWVTDQIEEMTAGEKDAVDAAALVASRDSAVAQVDQTEDVLRALLLTLLDEFNAHATKTNAILDAVDAATSLADMKTRVGTINDHPQRTVAQLRTAIRNKLGS
jgi:hypothetical protein